MQRQALKVKAQREKARRHIIDFAPLVYPSFEVTRHQSYIAECLERAANRESGWTRLIFHAPPQHGKSLLCSKLFPAWYRGKFPDDPIIITAYGDDHAHSFSRFVRNTIDSREYQRIFPGVFLASDSGGVEHWDLAAPHRGEFHAAGIMGQITGKGAMLLVLDDPIKNRQDAESTTIRERFKDQWRSTLATRVHANGIIIMIMTRWHEDDAAGFLIREAFPSFRYIKLSALADRDDILGRRYKGPLWPQRFPQPFLLNQKIQLGSYEFEALYQGHPKPPGGFIFKRDWFTVIDKAPVGLQWCRYWDLAVSTKQSADYTASLRTAVDKDGNVYYSNMIRGRWQWPDVRKKIKVTCLQNQEDWHAIEMGGTQSGMVQEMWNDEELAGLPITGVPVTMDKKVRAIPLSARAEAGKIYLVDGDWVPDFIDEMISFDHGEHDDQVDTATGGFKMASMGSGGIL